VQHKVMALIEVCWRNGDDRLHKPTTVGQLSQREMSCLMHNRRMVDDERSADASADAEGARGEDGSLMDCPVMMGERGRMMIDGSS
jgi:hypothetical protein